MPWPVRLQLPPTFLGPDACVCVSSHPGVVHALRTWLTPLDLAVQRRLLDESREAHKVESATWRSEAEVARAEARAEADAVARAREALSRERAASTTSTAALEATLKGQRAEMHAERALLDEAKQKVMAERQARARAKDAHPTHTADHRALGIVRI
eukprot:6188415-Pleurochrysis_carterae.AAC.1